MMSKPFFIWTMRRTGGTSLTDLLMALSEHRSLQHEPFLIDRSLGYITQAFIEQKYDYVRKELEGVFAQHSLIKHCYETVGSDFNDAILDVISRFDEYRHIFLLRQDETARMLSLMLAFQTDVWGKHGSERVYEAIRKGEKPLKPFDLKRLRDEERKAIEETAHIKKRLTGKGIEYFTIYFEDLYTGERQKRMKNLQALFDYLEFEPPAIKAQQKRIEQILFNRSQKSHSVLEFVPNLNKAKEILDRFPKREIITGGKKGENISIKREKQMKQFEKLTLYLGAHKTATTHLQGILHANRSRLKEKNIQLSMPGDVRKEWLPAFFHWCNHKDEASRLTMEKMAPSQGTWLLTEENIAGVSNDLTIKSGIYPHIKSRLACLHKAWPQAEMSLFFSLRSYETFYRSAYSEVIRNRGYIPFKKFYDEERFRGNSWVDTVKKFVAVIPEERITLWRYEDFRSLVPEILSRMTGIDDAESMISAYAPETTRPSLSQKTVDILDDLHPVLDRKESKKLVERINNAYPVSGGYAPLRTFSPEQEEAFRRQYDEDVAEIRRRWPKINFLGMD